MVGRGWGRKEPNCALSLPPDFLTEAGPGPAGGWAEVGSESRGSDGQRGEKFDLWMDIIDYYLELEILNSEAFGDLN